MIVFYLDSEPGVFRSSPEVDSGQYEQERKNLSKYAVEKKKREINLLFRTISSLRLSFNQVAGTFATVVASTGTEAEFT